MAAAIAAVAAAMAVFAFLTRWVGPAWACVIVAAIAVGVVPVWSLLQKAHRDRTRQPPLVQRVLQVLHAHPTAAFLAGLAAALWKARKGA